MCKHESDAKSLPLVPAPLAHNLAAVQLAEGIKYRGLPAPPELLIGVEVAKVPAAIVRHMAHVLEKARERQLLRPRRADIARVQRGEIVPRLKRGGVRDDVVDPAMDAAQAL